MYKFIVAKQVADIIDPEKTLGIEITDPAVAAACGLGNIDPQHGHDRFKRDWTPDRSVAAEHPRAAIEAVYGCSELIWSDYHTDCGGWPVGWHHWLPPSDATLATTRPDVDSVGAMAAYVIERLVCPSSDRQSLVNEAYTESVRARVRTIAEVDSFRAGPWAPKPLPTPEQPWTPGPAPADGTQSIAHLGAICSPRPGQAALPLNERVAIMACWLLWGDGHGVIASDDGVTNWPLADAVLDACGCRRTIFWVYEQIDRARAAVLDSRVSLAREARRSGAVELYFAQHPCGTYNIGSHVNDDGTGHTTCYECGETISPTVAIVRVSHAGALGLGYCLAPVVLAFDQAVPGKVTICEYGDDERRVDWDALKRSLNAREVDAGGVAGWGGPRKLLGSPQAGGTKLDERTIVEIVRCSMFA